MKRLAIFLLFLCVSVSAFAGDNRHRARQIAPGASTFFGAPRGAPSNLDQVRAGFPVWFPCTVTWHKCFECATQNGNLLADYSIGSRLHTYTATRTGAGTSPGTYTDANGVMQLATATDNTPRLLNNKGYYDATGFHLRTATGIWAEAAGTNYIKDSYMNKDTNSDGICDNWSYSSASTITGTPVYTSIVTTPAQTATELLNIAGAGYQRVTYTGVAGDTAKTFNFVNTSVADASFFAGENVAVSVFVKGTATNCNFKIGFTSVGAGGSGTISTNMSSAFTLSASGYTKVSYALTAANEASKNISNIVGVAGTVTVTLASATLASSNNQVTIAGTTNFNGTYTITKIDTTHYTFAKAGDIAAETTGTSTLLVSRAYPRIYVTDIDEGDAFDISFTCVQIEKSPYATTFIPTTTAALTRGAETLKYANLNNATAAQESIFVKFTPESTFANDGISRRVTDTDTSRLMLEKDLTTTVRFGENGSRVATGTTAILANTSYVAAGILASTGNPNKNLYINGVSEGTENTDVSLTHGTYMYLGSNNFGATQLNGIISRFARFNRALSASEVLKVSNYLNEQRTN